MLSKQDLVAKLKEYDFSKQPDFPSTERIRPSGIGNMIKQIEQALLSFPELGFDDILVGATYRAYGFIWSCYASVDFEELKENRDEPAVDILFRGHELSIKLGRTINTFLTNCARTKYNGGAITADTEGYNDSLRIVREMKDLDKDRAYTKRIAALEAELYRNTGA